MADDKKEPWLNYLALTTVLLAVCATLSTFKGGGYSTRSVISQAKASDQWAYFQAKGIKSYLYELQAEKLELEVDLLPPTASKTVRDKMQAAIDSYKKKVKQYQKERDDIQATAQKLEAERDDAQVHGKPFGIAVIYLQVAILLSSIAGLFKNQWLWFLALPVGALGALYFADGFYLWPWFTELTKVLHLA